MTGPVDAGAQVAQGIIETMKNQPMTLALVLFNLLFAVLVFLGSKDFRANQLQLMSKMIEMSAASRQLLSRIIPPADRRGSARVRTAES
jgi:hypothetical protein